MQRFAILLLPALLVAGDPSWEPAPQRLAEGRSPKFLTRRAHGILAIYSSGGNLYYRSSNDVGETFTPPQRVNDVEGEVSDHGENSAQLLFSPDEMTLYAVWNSRDPKNPAGTHIRFSRAGAMMTAWSPAVTLNDDGLPVSHAFQGAAVAPDGTIYAAWLDARDKARGESDKVEGATAGTSSLYLAISRDGGTTWEKNVRVAKGLCPCCRVAIGFAGNAVILTYRGVEAGDVRDIMAVRSTDGGRTWSAPAPVARDAWKIKGCPHVGASVASIGDRVWVAWYTEGGGMPGIFLAESRDQGATWSPKKLASEGTLDPTHPHLAASDDRLAVVFQARDAAKDAGWGKMAIWYREISPDGAMSKLHRLPAGEGSVSYPVVALGMSGRVFAGWTETTSGKSTAVFVRGRSTPLSQLKIRRIFPVKGGDPCSTPLMNGWKKTTPIAGKTGPGARLSPWSSSPSSPAAFT